MNESELLKHATEGNLSLIELLEKLNIHWSEELINVLLFQLMFNDSEEKYVSIGMRLIKDKDFHLSEDIDGFKSLSKSVELRIKGNTAYNASNYHLALECYTKSIATAPYLTSEDAESGTEDFETLTALSYAVANRSNILFKFKKFESCLKDISFALEMNYPKNMHFKLLARKIKCFKALKQYEEIQDNIQVAINSLLQTDKLTPKGKEQMKYELERIYEESLKSLQTGNIIHPSGFQCEFHANVTLGENSFYSNCTEVKLTENMGRGLFATKDIQPGDIVLIEKPFVSALNEDCFHLNCYECFKECSSLIPCRQCSLVMFCSEECNEISWRKHHHLECSILPTLAHKKILFLGSLALRSVITASKIFDSLTEFYQTVSQFYYKEKMPKNVQNSRLSDYLELLNLTRNKSNPEQMLMCSIYVAFLIHLLEKRTNFFLQNSTNEGENSIPIDKFKNLIGCLLIRHILNQPHRVEIYKKGDDDVGFEEYGVGTAIYLKASMINHSCDPNVIRYTCNGNQMILRAWRVIKKGEQIFDTYGPVFGKYPLTERKKFLLHGYNFLCQCTACTENWPLEYDLPLFSRLKCKYCSNKLNNHVSSPIIVCKVCQKITNVTKIKEEIKVAMEKMLKSKFGGNMHLREIKETMEVLNTCMYRPSSEMFLCWHYMTEYFLMLDHDSNLTT